MVSVRSEAEDGNRVALRSPSPTTAPQGRCVVTGGVGFLGKALRHALESADIEVESYDVRGAGSASEKIGDILDDEALDRAFSGATTVCHLAAINPRPGLPPTTYYTI